MRWIPEVIADTQYISMDVSTTISLIALMGGKPP
jgi:hypothetical protein